MTLARILFVFLFKAGNEWLIRFNSSVVLLKSLIWVTIFYRSSLDIIPLISGSLLMYFSHILETLCLDLVPGQRPVIMKFQIVPEVGFGSQLIRKQTFNIMFQITAAG